MRTVVKGNGAVAHAVRMARAEVMSAYPITPQTSIIEELADMVARGELAARFIKVESEHSAMAGCVAAASVGARTFTATSAHGLAYMHEMLHWAAGSRLPIVMVNVNRALGPGWNLWAEHSDSMAQRDTGWMQVYCQSAQEAGDTVIQAFEVSQRVLLPTMVLLDAFFLSHTYEDTELPEQELVDRFLSPPPRQPLIDLAHPASVGPITDSAYYMEFRHKMELAQRQALIEWRDAGKRWGELTGRPYGLIDEYRTEDAEVVLVATATAALTARVAIDELRRRGIKAGLVRLRVFRPFPSEELCRALAGRKAVVVLDRSCSFGHGGALWQETRSALYALAGPAQPPLYNVIAGLGGRDITPEDIEGMLLAASRGELTNSPTWWNTLPEKEKGEPVTAGVAQ